MRSLFIFCVFVGGVLCLSLIGAGLMVRQNNLTWQHQQAEISHLRDETLSLKSQLERLDGIDRRLDRLEQSHAETSAPRIEAPASVSPLPDPTPTKPRKLERFDRPLRPSRRAESPPRVKIEIPHRLRHDGLLTERLSRSANADTRRAINHFEDITR